MAPRCNVVGDGDPDFHAGEPLLVASGPLALSCPRCGHPSPPAALSLPFAGAKLRPTNPGLYHPPPPQPISQPPNPARTHNPRHPTTNRSNGSTTRADVVVEVEHVLRVPAVLGLDQAGVPLGAVGTTADASPASEMKFGNPAGRAHGDSASVSARTQLRLACRARARATARAPGSPTRRRGARAPCPCRRRGRRPAERLQQDGRQRRGRAPGAGQDRVDRRVGQLVEEAER